MKEFPVAQSRLFSQLCRSVRFRQQTGLHGKRVPHKFGHQNAGLEATDAAFHHHYAVPLLYMCSCRFGGLSVYVNSVTNYVVSTQICVSPKGNVLVHKLGYRGRSQTQWYMISTAGCANDLYHVLLRSGGQFISLMKITQLMSQRQKELKGQH